MTSKKVAFLVDGSFYPIRNGTDYSIDTLMRSLARWGDVQTCLLLDWRGWDNPSFYEKQPFETMFIPAKHFYHKNGILEYALSMRGIDFLHIYNSEEVINLSSRIKQVGVQIIYEAVNIDHVLYASLGADEETLARLRETQITAMSLADHVLCRSQVDKNHIATMGIDPLKVSTYRGAINADAIPHYTREGNHKNIVFLGHMYYPPNENALDRIATIILPQLNALDKQYTITIIGSTPNELVRKYSKLGIIFKNGVDNLGDELKKYDLAIAPLFEGSGTRLKLLDFLASGIPTVATTLSIEGLHESILDSLIIEDSLENYATTINQLADNEAAYQGLSTSGRKYVEAHYDWKNNLKPFTDIYLSH